jgi:predicted GNAT family N-acyltransferase
MKTTNIRIANTETEKQSIYTLRYEVYVEEMHRNQPYADHQRRMIKEPADRTAILMGAWEEDELVGTIRINKTFDTFIEYPEIYDLEETEAMYDQRLALITKLMIKKDRRGGRICLNIFRETFKVLRAEGINGIVIDANDHLLGIYSRIGFRSLKEKLEHPLYGMVTPMVMDLKDYNYFKEIDSPLTDLCQFYNGMERISAAPFSVRNVQAA